MAFAARQTPANKRPALPAVLFNFRVFMVCVAFVYYYLWFSREVTGTNWFEGRVDNRAAPSKMAELRVGDAAENYFLPGR
jgi:hypothetical protein